MQTQASRMHSFHGSLAALVLLLFSTLMTLLPLTAQALPTFARQTGQNCVACHTGGQFPELTPYGRMFKMTGYTIGERTIPFAVMGVASYASVADTSKSQTAIDGVSTTSSLSDFYKNNEPIFATGSLFVAGKITDNIGAFVQISHDPYAVNNDDGSASGHTNMDNIDIRFADRLISDKRDLIYGVSLNNNPSVSDPWNTADAWLQYVPTASPTSHQFTDGYAPYPATASDGGIAGLTAYAYLNKTFYGEFGFYGTADGAFRLFREGTDDSAIIRLQGYNPYWRLAYTREWGPSNVMVGLSGMQAKVYDYKDISDPSNSDSYNHVRSTGFDAQYQYILDPHTFTAQFAYTQIVTDYSAVTMAGDPALTNSTLVPYNPSDTVNTTRLKLAYTYQAKYGGSVSLFSADGTTNPLNMDGTLVTGNEAGNPGTSGYTLEAFYIPIQNLRLGVQYTGYDKYHGASTNYDGNGRNASDNNTLYAYAWFAF